MLDVLAALAFAGIAVSFAIYAYAVLRLMLSIPFWSWFPFGIWSLSELRQILGSEYDVHMRRLTLPVASVFGFSVMLALLSLAKQ